MSLRLVLPVLLFSSGIVFSQSLTGTIRDKATHLPLEAATVYLDGTTLVGFTDAGGNFSIGSTTNASKLLVATFVGYETAYVQNPLAGKPIVIELEKSVVGLQEVVLGKSDYSRKQLLEVFRQHFIGTSKAAHASKIENEQDLVLFFDPEEKALTATSSHPLLLKNEYLGYEVTFDLKEFRLEYRDQSLNEKMLLRSLFSVSSFYKDRAVPTEKIQKRRLAAYAGSASHFMNTLAHERWDEEPFEVFVGQTKINPKIYFQTKDTLGFRKVSLIKAPEIRIRKRLNPNLPPTPDNLSQETVPQKTAFYVLYKKKQASWLSFTGADFLVDDNGNFQPAYIVMLNGYMGSLKAADLLPTDYFQTFQEQRQE